jgi:hypothetical protein
MFVFNKYSMLVTEPLYWVEVGEWGLRGPIWLLMSYMVEEDFYDLGF